nr:hypothetical protein [uncultured bacterium]
MFVRRAEPMENRGTWNQARGERGALLTLTWRVYGWSSACCI